MFFRSVRSTQGLRFAVTSEKDVVSDKTRKEVRLVATAKKKAPAKKAPAKKAPAKKAPAKKAAKKKAPAKKKR